MTRSAREAIAEACDDCHPQFKDEYFKRADRILAKLAEEGWVVVPREMILQAGIKLSLSEFRSDHAFADAMLAAINGEGNEKEPQPEGRG